jgi:hypothetical protein
MTWIGPFHHRNISSVAIRNADHSCNGTLNDLRQRAAWGRRCMDASDWITGTEELRMLPSTCHLLTILVVAAAVPTLLVVDERARRIRGPVLVCIRQCQIGRGLAAPC